MTANSLYRRKRIEYDIKTPQQACDEACRLFSAKNYLEAFDLVEQLITAYPQSSINLLAQIYDWFKIMGTESRYTLYQSRVFDFHIPAGMEVLDIGSGHLPFPFATVLADFALADDAYGRAGVPFKKLDGRDVYGCNVEEMPFSDKQFYFVNCSHVLEHTMDPQKACEELMRVAQRGYIETPNPGKDTWLNSAKPSNHRWAVTLEGGTLVFREYTPMQLEGIGSDVLMEMHVNPQTIREKAFSALLWLRPEQINTMFMWDDKFTYRIVYNDGRELTNKENTFEKTISLAKPQTVTGRESPLIDLSSEKIPEPQTNSWPTIFTIETVLGCNLACPECALGGNKITRPKGFMSFEKFKEIFDKVKPYCKYLYAHIWGEPTLNKDILKIIRYAAETSKVNISTNAVNLTEKQTEELITSGMTDLLVSIDGMTQEVYSHYRVGGDVNSALNNLANFQKYNQRYGHRVNIMPQFIVFEHNKHQMQDFANFCATLSLRPFFKPPYLRDGEAVKATQIPQFRRPEFNTVPEVRKAMTGCGLDDNCVILFDGSVVVCCHDYNGVTNMGNIFEKSFEEIWNQPEYQKFRDDVKNGNAPSFCQKYCMSYLLKKQP